MKVTVTDFLGDSASSTLPVSIPSLQDCDHFPGLDLEELEAANCINSYGGDKVFAPVEITPGSETTGSGNGIDDTADLGDRITQRVWWLADSNGDEVRVEC